jgi:putative endonuclease
MTKIKEKNNIEIGKWGENMATEYLITNGHEIVFQNYRSVYGEIDIITRKENKIHFIEVKTVSRETLKNVIHETHSPEENVHNYKISRICRSAEYFMFENRLYNIYFQIDLITIRIIGEDEHRIEYYQNINL